MFPNEKIYLQMDVDLLVHITGFCSIQFSAVVWRIFQLCPQLFQRTLFNAGYVASRDAKR